MMTAPTDDQRSMKRVALRVGLYASISDDCRDGVWWPQSRDLRVEVADLVDNFPDPAAGITRVLLARSDWVNASDGRPVRQVRSRHGEVNVGFLARGGARTTVLLLGTGQRLRLRVIASSADPRLAGGLLRDAGEPRRVPATPAQSAAGPTR